MTVQNTQSTSMALVPCFSLGDHVFAPQLVFETNNHGDEIIRGSLISPLFKRDLAGSLGVRMGLTPEQLDIQLMDVLDYLSITLDEHIKRIMHVTITRCDIHFNKTTRQGLFSAETENLSITTLICPNDNGYKSLHVIKAKVSSALDKIMPLVDTDTLPAFDMALGVVFVAEDFSENDMEQLQRFITNTPLIADNIAAQQLQQKSLVKGTTLSAVMSLDGHEIPLALPLQSTQNTTTPLAPGTQAESSALTPAESSAPANKPLGPIAINNLNMGFKDGQIKLAVDAYLNLSRFQVVLMGLTLKAHIETLMSGNVLDSLSFDLAGLYACLDTGGFMISGGLLRNDNPADPLVAEEYIGQLSIKTTGIPLSLTALGLYSKLTSGSDSLFAYLALNYPIGGVPAFFVTGLALGFGYNRGIRVPGIHEVAQFPLVSALDNDKSVGKSLSKEDLSLVRARFESLAYYLPASEGQYVVAAGLQFSTFELLQTTAVLMVEFGQRMSLTLLGKSRLSLPKGIPQPVVSIEMAFLATLQPARGFFGIEAALTDNSYLLSPDCRLTGQFAYYQWYSGEHSGDFVVSLGGYHPAFKRPAHYPAVEALGFSWQISPQLACKGGIYGALTPSMVMTGGRFECAYRDWDDRLQANFNANAHFMVAWAPFSYRASVSTEVSVSYLPPVWGAWWLHAHLGASLELWGPDFSGIATLSLSFISFDIAFGHAVKGEPDPVSWSTFSETYVPDTAEQMTEIAVLDGQRSLINDTCVIDPENFELLIGSNVPVNSITVNTEQAATEEAFHLAPMAAKTVNDWQMTVETQGDHALDLISQAIDKNYPAAAWGPDFIPDLDAASTVGLLSGIRLTPAEAAAAPHQYTSTLLVDETRLPIMEATDSEWHWVAPVSPQTGEDAASAASEIERSLQSIPVQDRRQAIAALFGHNTPLSTERLAHNLNGAMIGMPQVIRA